MLYHLPRVPRPSLFALLAALAFPAVAQTTTWTRIASESQSFTVNGTQTVRYGAGSSWITKSVTNGGQCTNAYFGGDPAYGVVKQCELASSTSAAPTTAQICTPPIGLANTSGVAPSVGTGTPQSCTEAALRAAIASHSVITFNCGPDPATIPITRTIDIPTDRIIVVDGGHKVTLDGGGTTRIFSLIRANYRTNNYGLKVQRLVFANGRAVGTNYVPADPSNPACAYGYTDGFGGAIQVRDAKLWVVDSAFRNNKAATPGPDVGGGAIHALGSLDVTIVGSTFDGNSGSNHGAVGLLQSNGRFYNDVFTRNVANGTGQNYYGGAAMGCPGLGHANQGGAGGNGGAIGIDGKDDTDVMVCGSKFVDNRANELAGAIGRTANVSPRRFTIDRSLFQGNRAKQGGALFLMNQNPLEIRASTFSANVARAAGAAQFHLSRLDMVNSTFAGNEATAGIGGGLMLSSMDTTGVIRNATFTGNKSSGGVGYFAAAVGGNMNFPVYNTVFANNITSDGGSPMQCYFTPASGAYDMQWPRYRVLGGAADTPCVNGIVFADPQLAALANNGGPTPTARPSSTSPLRGAGRNCPPTDQRGVARSTAQCTVGAVE